MGTETGQSHINRSIQKVAARHLSETGAASSGDKRAAFSLMPWIKGFARIAEIVLTGSGLLAAASGQANSVTTIEGRVGVLPHERPDRLGWLVWVDDVPGQYPPPQEHAILSQKGMNFIPHILPILAGTTVDFPNGDPFGHNVYSISAAKRFNLGLYPQGRVPTILFDKPGSVTVMCNVHPNMSAYIIVLKTPFFAVPEHDGHFIIRNVPSGNRVVQCWSEDGKIRETKVILLPGAIQKLDY